MAQLCVLLIFAGQEGIYFLKKSLLEVNFDRCLKACIIYLQKKKIWKPFSYSVTDAFGKGAETHFQRFTGYYMCHT